MKVALLAALLLGASLQPLDSQVVLDRYALALEGLATPKAVIFTYTVSQAGPANIDQRHRVYRSGIDVRDEMVAANGTPVHRKSVRIEHRPDPYNVSALAPRADAYELLFLNTVPDGNHLDYVYQAMPLERGTGGFVVDRVTIDGLRFLPRSIDFHVAGVVASASGRIEFAPQGRYWLPLAASVSAVLGGSVARERILFSEYSFPPALPRATFL